MGKIYMFLVFSLAWCSMTSAQVASVGGIQAATQSEIKQSDGQQKAAISTASDVADNARKVPFEAIQQSRDITGTVRDEDGVGLPGVSVLVEGTSQGTVTDNDGKFSITVPSNET